METRYKRMRRTLAVFSGFVLALLSIHFPDLYAEERRAARPVVELKEGKKITRVEQPKEPDNSRETVGLVGPSGEEIHDFLYPPPKNSKVATPTN